MTKIDEVKIINDMLVGMDLCTKVGQMKMAERGGTFYAAWVGVCLVLSGSHPGENRPADWVIMNDEFWQAEIADEDSPGIPIFFDVHAVHRDYNIVGATIFPHSISQLALLRTQRSSWRCPG